MSCRINSACPATDHGDSRIGQLLAQTVGGFLAVVGGQARADDGNRAFILGQEVPLDVEEEGGIMDLAEERRVLFIFANDDPAADVFHPLQLAFQIDRGLPVADGGGGHFPHALHAQEVTEAGFEDILRLVKCFEELRQRGRPDSVDHVEDDIGFVQGHGGWSMVWVRLFQD